MLTLGPSTSSGSSPTSGSAPPLLVERGEPGRFDGSFSLADAERLVCETGIRVPGIRLVKHGAPAAARRLQVRTSPWRPGSSRARVVGRVEGEFARGRDRGAPGAAPPMAGRPRATAAGWRLLRLPGAGERLPDARRRAGFAVHHDTHDVLVLQVAGRERWRVGAPVSSGRSSTSAGRRRRAPGRAAGDEFTLERATRSTCRAAGRTRRSRPTGSRPAHGRPRARARRPGRVRTALDAGAAERGRSDRCDRAARGEGSGHLLERLAAGARSPARFDCAARGRALRGPDRRRILRRTRTTRPGGRTSSHARRDADCGRGATRGTSDASDTVTTPATLGC